MGATFISKRLTTVFGFLPLKEKKEKPQVFPQEINPEPATSLKLTCNCSFRPSEVQECWHPAWHPAPPRPALPNPRESHRLSNDSCIFSPVSLRRLWASLSPRVGWEPGNAPQLVGEPAAAPHQREKGPADLGNPWGKNLGNWAGLRPNPHCTTVVRTRPIWSLKPCSDTWRVKIYFLSPPKLWLS